MQIKSRQAKSGKKRFWTLFIALLFFAPLVFSYGVYSITEAHSLQWWQARTDSTGMAPDPRSTTEAIVQVYAARAFSWRGVFGVHTWFAVKPSNARSYTRYEVFGWGVRRGRPALLVRSDVAPDGYWFGSQPELLDRVRRITCLERLTAAFEFFGSENRLARFRACATVFRTEAQGAGEALAAGQAERRQCNCRDADRGVHISYLQPLLAELPELLGR